MNKIGFLSADICSLFQIYLILTSQIQPIGYDLTSESFFWPEFEHKNTSTFHTQGYWFALVETGSSDPEPEMIFNLLNCLDILIA